MTFSSALYSTKRICNGLMKKLKGVLDAQLTQIYAAGGVVAQAHLRAGRPDKVIIELGEELNAGLIVVGSRGLGGIRRALIGSVSESIVRHAHCPVLVVRTDKR
jgi:nucleotide-binding universal stress UspA family protein